MKSGMSINNNDKNQRQSIKVNSVIVGNPQFQININNAKANNNRLDNNYMNYYNNEKDFSTGGEDIIKFKEKESFEDDLDEFLNSHLTGNFG